MSNDVSRNSKIKRKNTMILLSVIIVAYVVVSTLVLLCMKNAISNEGSIDAANWLGFLGSYVGGVLGGLGTLIAVVITVVNALNIQKKDRDDRRAEQIQATRIELTNRIAEYLGTYITHITNYDNNVSEYRVLEKEVERKESEYVNNKKEYNSFMNELKIKSRRGYDIDNNQKILKEELESKISSSQYAYNHAKKDLYKYEKYSEHLEANEVYFVIKAKTEYIDDATKLIECLEEVHNNAGNEHESNDWIESITKQLIYEFHKFKQAYVGVNDL